MSRKKAKPSRGRPTALTEVTQAAICRALRGGHTRDHAARIAGVTPQSVCAWMRAGRAAKSGVFFHFFRSVQAAEAAALKRNLATVAKAARERDVKTVKRTTFPDGRVREETTTKREFDWAAARWWLACRFPEDYGPDAGAVRDLEKKVEELMRLVRGRTAEDAPAAGA